MLPKAMCGNFDRLDDDDAGAVAPHGRVVLGRPRADDGTERLTEPSCPAHVPPPMAALAPLRRALAVPPRRGPSEYRLANLHLYRDRHAYRLIEDADGLALLGTTYDGERHALPFGPLTPERAGRLLDHAACLYPIAPDEAAPLCAAAGLAMDDRAEDADYLYEAAALARLAGAKAKRAQAAAFAREAAVAMEPIDALNMADARAVLHGWFADVGREAAATDLAECGEALDLLGPLDLEGWLVRAEGAPVGFLIASAAGEDERVVHFAKGRRSSAGVYPWMFARFAAESGARLLNFEQDLGNPGLAQSKRAFAPCGQRRKMRIRRK